MKTIAAYIAKQAYVVAFITLCSDKLFLVFDKILGYGIAHESQNILNYTLVSNKFPQYFNELAILHWVLIWVQVTQA